MHPEHTYLRGRGKFAAQVLWLLFCVLLLAIFAIGIPVRWHFLLGLGSTENLVLFGMSPALESANTSRLGPQELAALLAFGMSPAFYAAYILTFEVGLVVLCTTISILIFWRKSADWMALMFSLILVLLGTNAVDTVVPLLSTVWSGWAVMSTLAGLLGMTLNVYILFLSPDGRFIPKWTGIITAGFSGFMFALAVYLVFLYYSSGTPAGSSLLVVAIPLWMSIILLGVGSQIYRYLRVSNSLQRQQMKWVVVGLVAVTIGFVLNAGLIFASSENSGLVRVLYNMLRAPLVNLCMVLLPVCVAISILRYRLWDIDILIRRTLTYALVTALLATVFLGSVIVLQQLLSTLTGSGQNELVTVLSTLAIAALFIPVRNRVQSEIDKRFNRKKYNAQQVLNDFANTVRDETDLEKLTGRLIQVVHETMQPKTVSVWLKPDQANERLR